MSALAHAQLLHRDGGEDTEGSLANRLERAVQSVKQAVSQCPSYDVLIPALLEFPLEVTLTLHHHLILVSRPDRERRDRSAEEMCTHHNVHGCCATGDVACSFAESCWHQSHPGKTAHRIRAGLTWSGSSCCRD